MPENITPRTRRTSAPDPRGPLVIDVRDPGRRAGSMRAHRRSVPAPTTWGDDLIGVPAGSPLELDVRVESVAEGVLVTGTVTVPIRGECARCLDPVTDEVVADVTELFAYPNSTTDSTTDQDEVDRIVNDLIDLEPVVRDAVVLGLPWTPLCSPDCLGLCPGCGQRLAELPTGHAHDTIDSRWAALAALTRANQPDSGQPGPDSTTSTVSTTVSTTGEQQST